MTFLRHLFTLLTTHGRSTAGTPKASKRGEGVSSSSAFPAADLNRLFAEADARKKARYSDDDLSHHIFGDC